MARAVLGGSPEFKKGEWVDGATMYLAWQAPYAEAVRSSRRQAGLLVENGFGAAATQLGSSPVLQRTSRADGVRMDFAWQVPYSQAVRSCTRDAWLMVREWIWCAAVCDGSLELQGTG